MVRVALDLVGGESAPGNVLEAARMALESWPDDIALLMIGPRELVARERDRFPSDRVSWIAAEERIGQRDPPARAVRRKPDSTIVRGLQAHRDGGADAFVSAGPTGATMVASVLMLGKLPGIDRPPAGAFFPTETGSTLVLDVGANVQVTPRQLHQFAHLGMIFLKHMRAIDRPRVGLLNMGMEGERGGDDLAEAHRLLAGDPAVEFTGNVEGHQIVRGACDILVCGGFVGNVLLKFYESIAGFVFRVFRNGGVGEGVNLERVLRFLDYAEYGGAPLLGVDGVTVICHRASSARAVANGIRTAADCAASGFAAGIRQDARGLPYAGAS